jgi:hypothetical protein
MFCRNLEAPCMFWTTLSTINILQDSSRSCIFSTPSSAGPLPPCSAGILKFRACFDYPQHHLFSVNILQDS